MKFCKQCGNKLAEDQKVCTNCGTPVNEQHTNQNTQPKEPKKMSKKTIIIIGVVALLLLLLFAVYKVFESKLSPVNEANEIANNIKKGNTKDLKSHLKYNDRELTLTESRAVYDYILLSDSSDQFASEVKSQVKYMKDHGEDSATIGAGDHNVLHIKKNGKKYGIFDNYDFEVMKEKVTIDPDSDSTITYKYNGKKHKIKLIEDNEKVFATLPIGVYKLDATKAQNGKTFDGNIEVNMVDSYEVTPDFKQKDIAVNIDSEYTYGDLDIDVYANGKKLGTYDSFEETTYGPFLPEEKVAIYAEVTVNGKKFKTNTVNLDKKEEGDVEVDLAFDDDAIADHKENEDTKEDVQTFMEDYTDALNDAYEEEDYSLVSSYIKSDTDTADHIENVVEDGGGEEFKDPKVTKYDKKGDNIHIEVEKKDKDGKVIKSKYVLEKTIFSDFEIKEYTDI